MNYRTVASLFTVIVGLAAQGCAAEPASPEETEEAEADLARCTANCPIWSSALTVVRTNHSVSGGPDGIFVAPECRSEIIELDLKTGKLAWQGRCADPSSPGPVTSAMMGSRVLSASELASVVDAGREARTAAPGCLQDAEPSTLSLQTARAVRSFEGSTGCARPGVSAFADFTRLALRLSDLAKPATSARR